MLHPPLSHIDSTQLLLSVCSSVGKALISLRMAAQLKGDPSHHQELHRARFCFSCPGCVDKQCCVTSTDGVGEQVLINFTNKWTEVTWTERG